MKDLSKTPEKVIIFTADNNTNTTTVEQASTLPTSFNIPTNMLVNGGVSVVLVFALAYFTRVLLQSVGQLIKVVKK